MATERPAAGRHLAKDAALCGFFLLFHCAVYAAARTAFLFGRIRAVGYANYAEQKTYKGFADDSCLERSVALLLICAGMSLIAMRSELTAPPFVTAGLLFYCTLLLGKALRLDPLRWLQIN